MKKRLPHSSRNKLAQSKGLTLVELLVAVSIIPVVLFASATLYLYAGKVYTNTQDRGQRLLEQLLTMQYIERTLTNATIESGVPVFACAPDPVNNCVAPEGPTGTCRMKVQMPAINASIQPPLIYEFSKAACGQPALLRVAVDADDDGQITSADEQTKLSYYGSVDWPIVGTTPEDPFSFDSSNNSVKVALQFNTRYSGTDPVIARSVVYLTGGQGT